MYRGYKVRIGKSVFVEEEIKNLNSKFMVKTKVDNFGKYKEIGEKLFLDKIKDADETLLQYLLGDGTLKGDVIQDKWFPVVKGQFDVFISHSHKEEDLALAYALSGWLYEKFNLKCFLDEYVWSSADGLIKKLDDLCRRPGGKGYNYRDRNMTTSQVHAMLTAAIMQEIDDCDALFFLNTPNTVDVVTETQEYTLSPWIFLEIGFSKLVKKEWKNEKRKEIINGTIACEAATRHIKNEAVVQMRMKLDTSHLCVLNGVDLKNWLDVWIAIRDTKNCDCFLEWNKKVEEYDPLIILDRQHKLPLKGPKVFLD